MKGNFFNKMVGTVLGVAVFSSGLAFAESPSFDLVELGYVDNEGFTGYSLDGSIELSENFYITATYTDVSDDEASVVDLNFSSLEAGVGVKYNFSSNSVVYSELKYLDAEAEVGSFRDNEDGAILSLGVRSMVANTTELFGEVSHNNLIATSTSVVLGARQYFTDNLGVFAKIGRDDFDSEMYSVGVSVRF